MNLDRAVNLLSRLHVKDRDSGASVPFVLNPNQERAVRRMAQQYEETGAVRACFLKARRVGVSSLLDALLFTYCLAYPQAHAEIVAHELKTSELGLFRVPHDLADELNQKFNVAVVRQRRIYFHHEGGDSLMDIATAGSIGSGRGLTLNALHLSEAAQYPPISGSFLSLLPAVSKGANTIVGIESTAFGKAGDGKAFYDFWNAACAPKNTPKWNGYVPIFLDWLHDPACRRPKDEAEDAPATDLERELMGKPFNASKAQIAWMRRTMESECQGEEVQWLQEYPHCPEVSFQSTGDPAFPRDEMLYAERTKKEPAAQGRVFRENRLCHFEKSPRGPLLIWEMPKAGCYYYIGADAAAGYETGDFAAYAILNGTTGAQAARYTDHCSPEELAEQLDLVGRWYNTGIVNIELTGNLGRWAQKRLRDDYMYPNLYRWKGKDDKLSPNRGKSNSAGWETNGATRGLLREAFREKIRYGMKNYPGGMEIYDAELVTQMNDATMRTTARWEVMRGHDDILMAWMLAAVTCSQYPPPNVLSFKANYLDKRQDGFTGIGAILHAKPQQDLRHALKNDLAVIMRPNPQRTLTSAVHPAGLAFQSKPTGETLP